MFPARKRMKKNQQRLLRPLAAWSVDRPYVDGLADGLHYPDRLKLARPVDRPTYFSRLVDQSTCLCVLKKIQGDTVWVINVAPN